MKPSFVIFAESTGAVARVRGQQVQFFPVSPAQADAPVEWASAQRAALVAAGYDGSGVLLAVPSAWCLAATIPIGDLPRRNRRALMIYRLEELLPAAAEDLVIDFSREKFPDDRASTKAALGVCTHLPRLASLVESLEREDICVQSVIPTALLAIQELHPSHAADVIVLATQTTRSSQLGGRAFELVELQGESAIGWSTQANIDSVLLELRNIHLVRESAIKVLATGLTETELAGLASLPEVTLVDVHTADPKPSIAQSEVEMPDADVPLMNLVAAIAAARVLNGEAKAIIEFRRDGLASRHPLRRIRTPLVIMAAAAILFALSAAASMLVLSSAYDNRASKYEAIQRSFYRETTGNQPPSGANVALQLLREDRRLQGISGAFSSPVTAAGTSVHPFLARPRSALKMLNEVLSSLPVGLRFRILEMQLSPEQVQLDGQARTHSDVDAIADGMRSIGSYIVDPPHSEVHGNDPGVSFTVMARPTELPISGENQRAGPNR